MKNIKEFFQDADWKKEKHVPAIELEGKAKKGETVRVNVSVGREIAHPNKTEHHIRWIAVFFLPENDKNPFQVGRYEFASHGESAQGPDTSTVYSNPEITLNFKTEKPGKILASSYCNIHGLWENSLDISLE